MHKMLKIALEGSTCGPSHVQVLEGQHPGPGAGPGRCWHMLVGHRTNTLGLGSARMRLVAREDWGLGVGTGQELAIHQREAA